MAKTRIKPNPAGIRAVLYSNEVSDALMEEAEQIATRAEANAPVESGEYQRSIHVQSGTGWDRAVARVVADAPHALIVEAKTNNLLNAAEGGDQG